jgi:hypothetical protein
VVFLGGYWNVLGPSKPVLPYVFLKPRVRSPMSNHYGLGLERLGDNRMAEKLGDKHSAIVPIT